MVSPRRALVSVSDKEGLVEFSRGLRALGFELIGSEGTAKTLKDAGLPVMTVADYTGLHEGLGGRVKTLHPKIFAGILAPRGDEKDLADLDAVPIDLVVVNLYPFETTVTKPGVGLEEAIENIDIGGVSLIRAAAKNATRVGVVVRPARYPDVLRALQEHRSIPEKLRNELAMEFERPAAVVIKHTNPSGVALASTLAEAYSSAHAADPVSAYGGVVGLNRPVDLATAKAMKKDVLDAVIAPEYEGQALDLLKSKKKGTFLILRTRGPFRKDHGIDMVRVLGGVLLQTTDFPTPRPEAFKVVTKVSPNAAQIRDILFGILVSRYVKSNSIVLVKEERTVGVGAGQMSRVDACMLACYKAKAAARGSVAVSDAYFPFRDGVDELAKGGVATVAQPGGSIRDDVVIAAADEHGIGMVFTGIRLFKH